MMHCPEMPEMTVLMGVTAMIRPLAALAQTRLLAVSAMTVLAVTQVPTVLMAAMAMTR